MCLGRVSPTFRVQAARWQPRPWVGHVLHLCCSQPASGGGSCVVRWWPPRAAGACLAAFPLLVARRCSNSQGGDPRTPEVLRGRCPVCALRQTARGGDPSTPSRLVADLPGGGPVALLMQTARGGDPKTPRGQEAHLFLGAWSLLSPSGYVAPVLPPAASAMSSCCCHDAPARYELAGL